MSASENEQANPESKSSPGLSTSNARFFQHDCYCCCFDALTRVTNFVPRKFLIPMRKNAAASTVTTVFGSTHRQTPKTQQQEEKNLEHDKHYERLVHRVGLRRRRVVRCEGWEGGTSTGTTPGDSYPHPLTFVFVLLQRRMIPLILRVDVHRLSIDSDMSPENLRRFLLGIFAK
ncbi:hypothetical protein CBL_01622 [Carabus blaptoides fortunei]